MSQARLRLHRGLLGPAGQDDGPCRRDHLGLGRARRRRRRRRSRRPASRSERRRPRSPSSSPSADRGSRPAAAGRRPRLRPMDTISFARGVPSPECLPVAGDRRLRARRLERDGKTILSYGPGGGYAPLRALDRRIVHGVEPRAHPADERRAPGLRPDRRSGSRPGRRVLVESPTYDRPLKILRGLGAEIVPLAMDEDGLDPDALEAALDVEPRRRRSSTRSRRSRTRRPHALRATAAGAIAELAAEHELLRARGRPVRPDPVRGRDAAVDLRPLGRERSRTPRPSRRRSARACASAGTSCRAALAKELEERRELDLHHSRAARPGRGLRVRLAAGTSSRTSCV